MDLKEKVKNLPTSPGVYLMKDSLQSVIYVGKSKNLKSRVGSYFYNSKAHSPKVVKLVRNLKDFDYILTDTEFEAFMLECKLIKEIKPIYNKLMKSPKSYSYIRIKINEKVPSIELSNDCSKSDGNLYFGPYTNRNTLERALQGIKEYFKILCTNNSRKGSACLNYSLGSCIGICLDSTPKEKYLGIVDNLVKLLNGTDHSIIKDMESHMHKASEEFDFEKAAKYRDYLNAVNYLLEKAKVVEYTEENKNIALIENLSHNVIKFFLIKGNKVLFKEKYDLNDIVELKSNIKKNILLYFNEENLKTSIEVGREEIDASQIIYSYIQNKANNCKHIIIPEEWLNSINDTKISNSIDKLFS